MSKNKPLVFVGTIKKVANCGESMKNHLFIERFREVFDRVITVDVFAPKKHPMNIVKMVLVALTHRRCPTVISVSPDTGDKVLRWLLSLGCNNIYYWAVGGTLHQKFATGNFNLDNYRKIKAIYVQSPRIVEGLKKLGINNAIHVNNSKRIDYIPDISHRNNDRVRFVFLSRVHPDKGCGLIVSCAKRLNEMGYQNKFSVDFYGSIFGYPDFKKMIEGVDNVNYKGFLNLMVKEGYDTLAGYDMMLFPTYWDGEGFPGVIIDACIAGVPVIASNWNCNEDVVDDQIGRIIPHHNEDALFEAMKETIEGKFDLKQMAKNCQVRALEYDNRNVLSIENLKKIGVLN